ncbi:MAG: GspH/FimT family pseudopilin [Gammaproteobacteria bacterium]|nr:GspH/FimT family pseudopilin [Gammaproteobacteria bacterium]
MDVENRSCRAMRGVTLIELIASVAVIGISLAVLIPSWSDLAGRNRITAAANSLLTDLRYARSTAVTRNRRIGLCPSDDGTSCSGNPYGWQQGYLIFVDRDSDGARGATEDLLQIRGAQPAGMRLHSTAGRPEISFRPDGAAWTTNTTLSVCQGDDPSAYRAVVLYGSGRARVDKRLPSGRRIDCR